MTHDDTAPVYGSAVTKVEPFGVDHIPDNERHGKPSSQFFVWFAAGLNFPIILLGFSAVGLGLSFGGAVAAIVAGAGLGSLLMAVMSRMGVRLGVPQQIQARGPLGFFGNFLPVAYINVFAGVGWAAVTVILGGKAIAELTHLPFWVCGLTLTLVELVVSIYGYNMINFLQRVLTYVLTPLFVMITVVALVRGAGTFGADPKAPDYVGSTGGWITFGGWFLSFLVAWAPFASDYSRYLPDSPRVVRRTAWYTGLGNFVTICWLGILGVLLGSNASSTDSITALHELTGPFAIPALIAIGLSALAQNFLNVYGGAISVQTLKVPVTRTQAVTLICALAYGISLWGHSGIEDKFSVFLNLTAYFIAPFATVLLLDYHLGGRSDPSRIAELYDRGRVLSWGFVAWAGGVVASVPFWQSDLYTGAFASAYPHAGDLSMFVAAAAAAVLYLLTYRLRPLWTRDVPATPGPRPEKTAAVAGS
ncbi:purine-cytosine permease family protein [Streptomyces violaceusniger]|uniref:Permease for cytosine/purines uracil thiamine allantoin n=1 Tax=Streptomyces violaceusniger (strain Tu 4113) TaxID=653045 RepID=G2NTP7_STRV4|nr:cytosine permease [Streptomyces violaceusniger]AEM83557.1 permease for cytosine/purines uracil thiamine allantoin [Streptomyces violaceusniger Tu 4113]